jgi:hypothetical protein
MNKTPKIPPKGREQEHRRIIGDLLAKDEKSWDGKNDARGKAFAKRRQSFERGYFLRWWVC